MMKLTQELALKYFENLSKATITIEDEGGETYIYEDEPDEMIAGFASFKALKIGDEIDENGTVPIYKITYFPDEDIYKFNHKTCEYEFIGDTEKDYEFEDLYDLDKYTIKKINNDCANLTHILLEELLEETQSVS